MEIHDEGPFKIGSVLEFWGWDMTFSWNWKVWVFLSVPNFLKVNSQLQNYLNIKKVN